MEETQCVQGLVCLAHLEAAAGPRFVPPAPLCSAVTKLLRYFLPSGLNPWENLGTGSSFHQQRPNFSSKQLEGQQDSPKQSQKGFFPFLTAVFSWFHRPQVLLPLPGLDFWVFLFPCLLPGRWQQQPRGLWCPVPDPSPVSWHS